MISWCSGLIQRFVQDAMINQPRKCPCICGCAVHVACPKDLGYCIYIYLSGGKKWRNCVLQVNVEF